MSKGSGLGGTSGGGGGSSGGSRGKVNIQNLGRNQLSGKAIQGLIAGRGGIAKSVSKVSTENLKNAISKYNNLSKSQISNLVKSVSGVKVKISHAYRNQKGGGGDFGIQIVSGVGDILAAKQAGATQILSVVTQVGPRGKTTTWTGLIKL